MVVERRLQKADAAVLAAEERARVAEARRREAHEQTKAVEISRVLMKERAGAAEAAKRSAEDLAQRSDFARQKAERRALAAEAGQLRAEEQMLALTEEFQELEKRLKEKEATHRRVQKQETPFLADFEAMGDVIRPDRDRRPPVRNTPRYVNWLMRMILSGKISRSQLCQIAGDSRIDGRLVH